MIELVMQILNQLLPSCYSIVDAIINTKPFPLFLEAKNMFLLYEPREESNEGINGAIYTSSVVLYSSAHTNGKMEK